MECQSACPIPFACCSQKGAANFHRREELAKNRGTKHFGLSKPLEVGVTDDRDFLQWPLGSRGLLCQIFRLDYQVSQSTPSQESAAIFRTLHQFQLRGTVSWP